MRIVLVMGIALTLAACSGRPLFLTGDPCDWVASHAERAEAEKVRREAEAKGRTSLEVEMAPIQAGERIPAAGKVAYARCQLQLAGIAPAS